MKVNYTYIKDALDLRGDWMDAKSIPILVLGFYVASISSAHAVFPSACICQQGKPCQTSEGIRCTHHHHKDLHVYHQEQLYKLHKFHQLQPSYPHEYSVYHTHGGLYGSYGGAYNPYGMGGAVYGPGAYHPLNHPYHPLNNSYGTIYHPLTNPYHPYSSTYHPYHINRLYQSQYPYRAYKPYGDYYLRNLYHPYNAYQPLGTLNW